MFVDRERELRDLERAYGSSRAELWVLYGRRRVGKTELLKEFCRGKPSLFFVGTLASDGEQLAAFSQAVWSFVHQGELAGFTYPTWEAAFRALAELPGRPVVVLDEFTYLVSGNAAIPSVLQKVWDETLKQTGLFLVLCGSHVGMMEREAVAYRAPLYGRSTNAQALGPLPLPAVPLFYPRYSAVTALEAWAVLGGMPFYLEQFDDGLDVLANARLQILDPLGRLHREPQLLLQEELREPRNYFSILRAVAQGHRRLADIGQSARVGDGATTNRYLDVLQSLGMVARLVPATETQPHKSKRGLYSIVDSFLRFWFRYVHPSQGALDLGLADAVLEQRVRPTFDQYVSFAFEDAARQHVARMAASGQLRFLPDRVGGWWDGQNEIDVVAVSNADASVLVGECKWWDKPVGLNVLQQLRQKATAMAAGRYDTLSFALFSKSGFTPDLVAAAESEAVTLVTPAEVLAP